PFKPLKPSKRELDSHREISEDLDGLAGSNGFTKEIKEYFVRKGITNITEDIINEYFPGNQLKKLEKKEKN
ncbi:unnamed protein product, partial [marine sediment metagenome]